MPRKGQLGAAHHTWPNRHVKMVRYVGWIGGYQWLREIATKRLYVWLGFNVNWM